VIPAPIKPIVAQKALEALDIRIGTIVLVEDLPKTSRLVRLTVDFGDHSRRVIAGLKGERMDLREIQGTQALFVVNLAPRAIMGEVSEGMLFDIGSADGITPALAIPERGVPNGARGLRIQRLRLCWSPTAARKRFSASSM
jgi:methionine--tRNA ligase beta chain